MVWHNYFAHQNRFGIETQGQNGGTYNTLILDYNEFDNTGLTWGIGISAVGEGTSGDHTSIRHNSFKNIDWAIEIGNQMSRLEWNYFTNVGSAMVLISTPNSIYQSNTLVNVTEPLGEDGGYQPYGWIGYNVLNGVTYFGWAGHTNNPVNIPNIWQ